MTLGRYLSNHQESYRVFAYFTPLETHRDNLSPLPLIRIDYSLV